MNLKNILDGIEGLKAKGELDLEIEGIESNSKKIEKGFLFVAIKGFTVDGHEFIGSAIENGAVAVVVDESCDLKALKIPSNITLIVAKDTREFLALASANFYGNPSERFKLIGITGTKGKTTTTFMIKEILEKAGKKVGLIGTIATYINGRKIADSDRTTPESLELQRMFADMVKEGVEYVVMEVSSQSLKLHRVDGCHFDITGYGIDNFGNFLAKDITITNSYVDFKAKIADRNERVKVDIPGRFTVYNALCAICVCRKIGIESSVMKEALEKIKVPGRSEMVENKLEIPIMIDYAHSPESLQNILQAVKSYTRGRVISVFGCGGDRDSRKRPVMGEISGKIADYTIITSDNPRTENPEAIVSEIEEGIKKTKGKYEVVVDRVEAITKAIQMANKTDIIVLAGKGHEPYQEINGVKHPFDERIIVNDIISKINKKGKN